MNKHTKGRWACRENGKFLPMDEWDVHNDRHGNLAFLPVKSGHKVVAIVVDVLEQHDFMLEELKANASLISAAPDLLQALEDLLMDKQDPLDADSTKYFWRQAALAVAKARGDME